LIWEDCLFLPDFGCSFGNSENKVALSLAKRSNTMATATILSSLKFTTATPEHQRSPVFVRRRKLVKQIGEQVALAEAQQNNAVYCATKLRTVKDNETGERRTVEVQKRVKSWVFATESGKLAVSIRYGARLLEISKGKSAVELANAAQLVPTLKLIAEAVEAGELDEQLEAASKSLRLGFK
jgi:hypothetical protein